MKLTSLLAAACATLVSACGGSDPETPERAAASPTGSPIFAPHIVEANKTCMAAQPAFGRSEARIEKAADVLEAGAKGAERKRQFERSGDAWMERHDTMAELFTQLRALHERGADQRYDTFLASWGEMLRLVESVAVHTGGDQEELESYFRALTTHADELAGAMIDANVTFCDPFMPEEERAKLAG